MVGPRGHAPRLVELLSHEVVGRDADFQKSAPPDPRLVARGAQQSGANASASRLRDDVEVEQHRLGAGVHRVVASEHQSVAERGHVVARVRLGDEGRQPMPCVLREQVAGEGVRHGGGSFAMLGGERRDHGRDRRHVARLDGTEQRGLRRWRRKCPRSAGYPLAGSGAREDESQHPRKMPTSYIRKQDSTSTGLSARRGFSN
jgi:hypothetical protein